MKICCPECGCVRQMPDSKIPDGILTAKCPECGCRFPFSKDVLPDGQEISASQENPASQERPVSQEKPASSESPVSEEKTASSGSPDAKGSPASPKHPGSQQEEPQERPQEDPFGSSDYDIPPNGSDERERGQEKKGQGVGRVISVNPWDFAPQPYGYLTAFYRTCLNVMFAPRIFFYGIGPVASVRRAFSFYAILCFLQLVTERLWAKLFLEYLIPAANDPQMQKLADLFSSQEGAIAYFGLKIVLMLAQVVLLSGMLCLIWQFVTRRRVDFSLVFQVLAYAEAPGLLCLIPFGSLAAVVWGVYCTVIGFRYAFGFTWFELLAGLVPSVVFYVMLQSQIVALLLGA